MAVGALLVLLTVAAARAQEVGPERMEAFAAALFQRMDLDGDGRLTPAEYEHTQGGGFKVDFGLLDQDGDGSITRGEYLLAVRRYHVPHSARPI
jgi:Ca2+-binding EF-hand superfamily protein